LFPGSVPAEQPLVSWLCSCGTTACFLALFLRNNRLAHPIPSPSPSRGGERRDRATEPTLTRTGAGMLGRVRAKLRGWKHAVIAPHANLHRHGRGPACHLPRFQPGHPGGLCLAIVDGRSHRGWMAAARTARHGFMLRVSCRETRQWRHATGLTARPVPPMRSTPCLKQARSRAPTG
jgi:hypothetical protein